MSQLVNVLRSQVVIPNTAYSLSTASWQYEINREIRVSSDSLPLHRGAKILEDIADISQCIEVILTTPQGTDPFRPDFAADFLPFIDRPLPEMTPLVIKEAVRAIETWEPRVVVESGVVDYLYQDPATLHLTLEWRLREADGLIFEQEVII